MQTYNEMLSVVDIFNKLDKIYIALNIPPSHSYLSIIIQKIITSVIDSDGSNG